MRDQLAGSLLSTLKLATAEDDLPRRDAELRALAHAHLDEAAVRDQLANGLFNTLFYASAEYDLISSRSMRSVKATRRHRTTQPKDGRRTVGRNYANRRRLIARLDEDCPSLRSR